MTPQFKLFLMAIALVVLVAASISTFALDRTANSITFNEDEIRQCAAQGGCAALSLVRLRELQEAAFKVGYAVGSEDVRVKCGNFTSLPGGKK